MSSSRTVKLIVFAIIMGTVAIIANLYLAVQSSAVNGHIPTVNMDALGYYQHARCWAEGHPYAFNPGDLPSTGCSSHLYPVVLSILYRLGCTGNKLITAGFFLNALFLIGYILCIWGIVKKFFHQTWIQLFSLLLIATNGHLITNFLGQSDIGLFTLATGLTFLCLASSRYRSVAVLTLLLPLIRPEGVLLNAAIATIYIVYIIFLDKKRTDLILPVSTCLIGILCLFALNFSLIGHVGFDSTGAGKGPIQDQGFWFGMRSIFKDTIFSVNHLISGKIVGSKSFFMIPYLGFFISLLPFTTLSFKKDSKSVLFLVWGLCIPGSLLVFSAGGSAFIHVSRYFTWIFPVFILMQVVGILIIRSKAPRLAPLLLFCVAVFNLSSITDLSQSFQTNCFVQASNLQKMNQMAKMFPSGTKVASNGLVGFKYICPKIYCMNLSGIDFAPLRGLANLSRILEAWREGDCVLPEKIIVRPRYGREFEGLIENKQNIPGIYFGEIWEIYDVKTNLLTSAALTPLSSTVLSQISGRKLTGSLNLGHKAQEKQSKYQVYSGLPGQAQFAPEITTNSMGGVIFADAATPVVGISSFELSADSDQNAILVIRLIRQGRFIAESMGGAEGVRLSAEEEILQVSVNDFPPFTMTQSFGPDDVKEVVISVPAHQIASPRLKVKLNGLHIMSACWVYQ